MPYQVRLTLFIIALVLAAIIFLFLFLYPVMRNFLYKKRTVPMYYSRIRRIVDEHDFLLINDLTDKGGDGRPALHLDHIVIGNKYFYCISDCYYEGCLKGSVDSEVWIYYHEGKKEAIGNPLISSRQKVETLSIISGIDSSMLVPIVLVNDDCLMTPIQSKKNEYIVSLRQLKHLIEDIESDPKIEPLNEWETLVAAKDLAEWKENGKKKR